MTKKITDKAMIGKVIDHPLRCKTLVLFADGEASPTEIGRALLLDASHVSYHVRVLHECGVLTLTDTVPVRGSVEHRYTLDFESRPPREWYSRTPPADLRHRAYLAICVLLSEMNISLSDGGFEKDHRLGRYKLTLDMAGREELAELNDVMDAGLKGIIASSAERLRASKESGSQVTAFGGYFDTSPPSS
jgi:DNA-binding transcriptional ArsR family regulator